MAQSLGLPGLGERPRPAPPPMWTPPVATPPLAAAPQPPVINYPGAAQQQALNAQNLSGAWGNWFASVFGPLATYYTPERGGPAQAQYDFRNWQALFTQVFGRPPDASDFAEVLGSYRQYAVTRGEPATLRGLYEFTARMYQPRPRLPPISYMRVTNL